MDQNDRNTKLLEQLGIERANAKSDMVHASQNAVSFIQQILQLESRKDAGLIVVAGEALNRIPVVGVRHPITIDSIHPGLLAVSRQGYRQYPHSYRPTGRVIMDEVTGNMTEIPYRSKHVTDSRYDSPDPEQPELPLPPPVFQRPGESRKAFLIRERAHNMNPKHRR